MNKTVLLSAILAFGIAPNFAYAKKRSGGGGAPTEAQRKAAWERGMKDCRKQWGSSLHEVHVEKFYGKWSVVCYHY